MIRIFASLSIVAIVLVATALFVGLSGGDYNGSWRELQGARQQVASQADPLRAVEDGGPGGSQRADLESQAASLQLAFERIRARARIHMLLGLAAVLLSVFVNSLSITYFVGTGRWCKEVTETYRLEPHWIERSTAIKRKSFPWSMLGMASVGIVAGLGAASDPGTLLDQTAEWVPWHLGMALITPAALGYAFYRQWLCIEKNQGLLQEIMQAVGTARRERGLSTAVEP